MSFAGRTYPGSAMRLGKPVLAIATAVLLMGCAAHPKISMPTHVVPFGRNATLIYVPGIGGFGNADRDWLKGVRGGGYEGKSEVHDWTGKLGSIEALWAHGRQRAEARRIAERICKVRSESPATPIVLVGHSAGAAVAVQALEDLSPDIDVNDLVLMAPALSRTYDLSSALRHVHRRADVFYSERDTLALAIGTFLFGTADGVHGGAAGHGGFVKPPGPGHDAYAKLYTHGYSRDRQRAGDDGGHEGVLAPTVAAIVLAPLLAEYGLPDRPIAQASAREQP